MPRPAPKKVATAQAQRVRVLGCGFGTAVAELFVIAICGASYGFAEVFEDFRIEYG